MWKKLLIIGGLVAVATVVVIFAIPWGEYESDLEKSQLTEEIEYSKSEDEEASEPPSLIELQGNDYYVETGEDAAAEIVFDLDGLKKTKGGFEEFSVLFEVDEEDFRASHLLVDIQSKSVNTGNTMRDKHLLEEDFFHVEKYPKITYESNEIALGDTSYIAKGKLTLNGTTKELDFPFLHLGGGKNNGKTFQAFEGAFEFDRVAYGQEESSGVGNLVKVNFYCELNIKE